MDGWVTIAGALAPAVQLVARLGCRIIAASSADGVVTLRVRASRLDIDRLALAEADGAVAFHIQEP